MVASRSIVTFVFLLAASIANASSPLGSGFRTRAMEDLPAAYSPLSPIRPFAFPDDGAIRPFPGMDSADTTVPGSTPDSTLQPAPNYGKLALIGGLMAGSIITIHIYQQNGWWRDNRAPFHFREDLVYGLSVDKIGHFYGASLFASAMRRTLEWADMPSGKAVWWGAGSSMLFQTYIEIEDGFSTWGFDRVDWLSNVGGAFWPALQYHYPALRNYNLKLSYVPSDLLDRPGGTGFRGQKHLMIDDYEGQTFWASVKLKNLLPKGAARYWPSFLCVAAGYGARDIAGASGPPYRVLYLALDYDFEHIIPQTSSFLRDLTGILNVIHFPAPTVRISPTAIWYGFFF